MINVNKALAQAGILEANLIQSEWFFQKADKVIICVLNLRAVK
ncbi:hypothetical protein [Campylobacter concisus]|nr:hypothetical protein [Campylobacter concisus]